MYNIACIICAGYYINYDIYGIYYNILYALYKYIAYT